MAMFTQQHKAPIRQNAFFLVRGVFFKSFSIGIERFARFLCAPSGSRFSSLLRLVFLLERSERLKMKKKINSEQKSAQRH